MGVIVVVIIIIIIISRKYHHSHHIPSDHGIKTWKPTLHPSLDSFGLGAPEPERQVAAKLTWTKLIALAGLAGV